MCVCVCPGPGLARCLWSWDAESPRRWPGRAFPWDLLALRTALSLAAVTGHELELVKIRAGREKPGLKRQHLTCVKAVAEICGAKVSDIEVGSTSLAFEPGPIKGGDYRFDIGTAGSVTLVAQTVIPVLLKADGPSTVTITAARMFRLRQSGNSSPKPTCPSCAGWARASRRSWIRAASTPRRAES